VTSEGLRVLIVSPCLPSTSWGFGTRVFHLARHLAERHSVTLVGYGSDTDRAYAEALRATGWDVRLIPREPPGQAAKRSAQLASLVSTVPFGCDEIHTREMQQAIDDLSSAEHFDVVQVESSQLCTFRFPAGAAVVLDEHNVEYELLRRMGEGERTKFRRLYNRVEQAKLRQPRLTASLLPSPSAPVAIAYSGPARKPLVGSAFQIVTTWSWGGSRSCGRLSLRI